MSRRDLPPALPHAVFAAVSILLAVAHASRTAVFSTSGAVEVVLPFVLAVVLVYAGVRFRDVDPTNRQVATTAGLLLGGGLYGAGFIAFIQFLQSLSGVAFAYPYYMVAMAGVGGVAMATVIAHFYVGYTQRVAEARAESSRARRLQKQASVLNRTLRHNLRNELQIIDGWLGAAFGQEDVEPEQGYRVAREHLDDLNAASERARLIERVLRTDERTTVDVAASVEHAAASVEHATVTTTTPSRAPAHAHPEVETAIEEAFENAVEHNDATDLAIEAAVSLSTDGGDPVWRVEVSDDGGGIPSVELDALRKSAEGPLEHGRGLGLYLIQTVVRQSDGDLSIVTPDADRAGTTLRMEFPVDGTARVETPQSDARDDEPPVARAQIDGSYASGTGQASLD